MATQEAEAPAKEDFDQRGKGKAHAYSDAAIKKFKAEGGVLVAQCGYVKQTEWVGVLPGEEVCQTCFDIAMQKKL